MKRTNTKTKATAIALTALMAVSTLGAATVSAAEIAPQDSIRTIYFVNNKGWENVNGYVWNTESGKENAKFPGEQLECVGTTTAGGFETAQEVYEMSIDTSKYDNVIFAEGGEHGQQSKDFNLNWTSQNGFKLDDNNYLEFIADFNQSDISTDESVATPNTASFTGEQNKTVGSITPHHISCFQAGEKGNTLYLDTTCLKSNSKPVVTLSNLNCTLTEATVKPQVINGNTVDGMYFVEVPQGGYYGATITIDGTSYCTSIYDTTDTVKLANVNGGVEAETCQRVFFSNTLSSKSMANQIVRIYSWNSVSNTSETSFNEAPRMTYYGNNEAGQNMYFYDVPSCYDHVSIFTKDFTNNNVTAQTSDITLGYSVNTADSIVMTGYYTTTSDKNVETYTMQVTR